MRNWHFLRILRLVLGILVLIQGISSKQYPLIFFGFIFTLLPIFNAGCAGGACDIPRYNKSKMKAEKDIEYEEVG